MAPAPVQPVRWASERLWRRTGHGPGRRCAGHPALRGNWNFLVSEALVAGVVGAASAGQNLLLERLNVREQRLQPLLVLVASAPKRSSAARSSSRALSARRSASSRLPGCDQRPETGSTVRRWPDCVPDPPPVWRRRSPSCRGCASPSQFGLGLQALDLMAPAPRRSAGAVSEGSWPGRRRRAESAPGAPFRLREARGCVLPQVAASRLRVVTRSARAWLESIRAAASATRAFGLLYRRDPVAGGHPPGCGQGGALGQRDQIVGLLEALLGHQHIEERPTTAARTSKGDGRPDRHPRHRGPLGDGNARGACPQLEPWPSLDGRAAVARFCVSSTEVEMSGCRSRPGSPHLRRRAVRSWPPQTTRVGGWARSSAASRLRGPVGCSWRRNDRHGRFRLASARPAWPGAQISASARLVGWHPILQ